MKLLFFPRIFNDKMVCLIRSVNNYKANIYATQQRLLQTTKDNTPVQVDSQQNPLQKPENDIPVKIENQEQSHQTSEDKMSAEMEEKLKSYVMSDFDEDAPIEMENPYVKERKLCFFCKHNIVPDYKNVRLLSQFQSQFSGRIYGRHITGLCKRQQMLLEREVLKAQHAGLMGFVTKNPKYYNDPKLFNSNVVFKERIRRH